MTENNDSKKLSREEIAKREIGQTEISPALSWLMTVLFILTLIVPPTVQLVYEVVISDGSRVPSSLELFHRFPDVAHVFRRTEGNLWERVLTANRRLVRSIEEYEKQLEERSLLTQHLLGPTQHWLTKLAGLGNEKVYIGRNGWLFYRPDVDYLTGPGFLEPTVLHRRALGGNQHLAPPQPDPRPAIIEFQQQLARRGIQLILMPMPSKSAIHPEQLSSRFDGHQGSLENASFQLFKQELEAAGVLVFDTSAVMTLQKGAALDVGQFLRTDTHWTPDAMQTVAERLKEFIDEHCPLPTRAPVPFSERIVEIENLGDIATMLHLPEQQTLFPPEMAIIHEVVEPDGHAWQSDAKADVLLLGDSYTNIYSLPEMKWGAAAGFAERLSFAMQRRIDRLAQNDGGSHAVRQTLYQQMARGEDRLQGKRVVIWEFAARELAYGDWKHFPMPPEKNAESPRKSPPQISKTESSKGGSLVWGTVRAAAGSPQPASVPYRDAVTGVHLDRVEGVTETFANREIIVYLFGLQDNRLTGAAKFTPEQKVKLRLTPWDSVRKKYERFNRIELDDPDFRLSELPTYWGEEVP